LKQKKDKQYRKLTKLVDKELKKISKRKKDGDLIEKKVQCKHCGFTVVFKGTRREHFNCPFCKKELIVSFSEEKPIEMKETKKEKTKEIKKNKKKFFKYISKNN